MVKSEGLSPHRQPVFPALARPCCIGLLHKANVINVCSSRDAIDLLGNIKNHSSRYLKTM